jgi:hypothetical protein
VAESKQILKEMTRNKKVLKSQSEKDYGDWEDFILFCYIAKNPQAYGSILEKRIIQKNGMQKVSASIERGDVIDSDGNYKEIKCSIGDSGEFNAVQIRPHHDIHSCLLFFFEIDETNNVVKHIFDIPEKDIIRFPGISVAHGTKKNANSKTEYRITFNKNTKDCGTIAGKAWTELQQYRVHKDF